MLCKKAAIFHCFSPGWMRPTYVIPSPRSPGDPQGQLLAGPPTYTTQDCGGLWKVLPDADSRQTQVLWQHRHLLATCSTKPASGGEG